MTVVTNADTIDGQQQDEYVTESEADSADHANGPRPKRRHVGRWMRPTAYCLVLALPLAIAIVTGYLKYLGANEKAAESARAESTHAAADAAVAMLSYKPDTVQNDLEAAKSRLGGAFRDSYSALVDDVVAPAAIQKFITATATVPAAAPMSATANHAVVLLFVNPTTTVGKEAPTTSNSTVRVTLDRHDGRWLVSAFDPI